MKRSKINLVGFAIILLVFLFLIPIVPETIPLCKAEPPSQGYYSVTFLLFSSGVVFYGGVPHLMWSGFPLCE